jgi:CheY-like chemotaxis protein
MRRVLIVDDDAAVLASLRRLLRRQCQGEFLLDTETDPVMALDRLRRKRYDVIVADLHMPELDGVGLLALAGLVAPQAVRLLLTGSTGFEDAQRAIHEAGVFRYLTKPWDDEALVAHLRAALVEAGRYAAPADPMALEAV